MMTEELRTLLSHPHAPPFVFLHHPHHPVTSLRPDLPARCTILHLDLVEHFNARIFYSSAVRQLDPGQTGDISSWDGFVQELSGAWHRRQGSRTLTNGTSKTVDRKGKSKAEQPSGELVNGHAEEEDGQIVLIICHAEKLRSVLGSHWPVVTRLPELVSIPVTVVLLSAIPWDELRSPKGDTPEPLHLYLPGSSREDLIRSLTSRSKHPLFPRFLDLLMATLLPMLSSPMQDLGYLAEPLWKIYTSSLPPHAEQLMLDIPYDDPNNPPPPLQVTVRLLTDLKHQMTIPIAAACEDLLTGQLGRDDFVQSMLARNQQIRSPSGRQVVNSSDSQELSVAAKFVLVAAYCASYNPSKSDVRLFGRGTGPDGKRRRGGGTRRAGYGRTRVGKIPQRLLGPKPFPLDRMLAMFASLYAEHATRPPDLEPAFGDWDTEDLDAEMDWLPSVDRSRNREQARRRREQEREELWEDEVDHLTMSVKMWSMSRSADRSARNTRRLAPHITC
ncbi:origin recognition complex subunit 5 C-terminus-domain-containing protein [Kockovaella imperatae]|uniref:Origin recognition complex subunit 5 C-terminus-domain-containing protein n=1 Tax=Kockovaella imperatae TaxID=4999 RepID=A0A1Y1UGK2_9TREE|nr:origin recognition complex subunit 5 C-terminus-domain-containing protein [Kockovaella imperatae]ORX36634.1 origin recognition complex subunit 5 C-terminus-domain-containing protein [Kockovaella imperatae]